MSTPTTSVPPVQFTPQGIVLPPESDILAGVTADINAAFGGGLNPALNTPQGQLASSQTAAIGNSNSNFAELVNQVNPDVAQGFMQDAILGIYFLTRLPGAPTSVQATCVGAANTPIPVGAQAQDTSGNLYVCTSGGIIPIGGSIILSFANVANGPIPCPATTLSKIYQQIPGWDSINNIEDGVLGNDVESQQAAEARRAASVAVNGHGTPDAIFGAVAQVPGVIDCFVVDNFTGAILNYGATNYPLLPHSVYVGVVGGAAADIAAAIYSKKDLGCDMNGNQTVMQSAQKGLSPPFPVYTYHYNIPTNTPVKFQIYVSNLATLPAGSDVLIQNAVLATFLGQNPNSGLRAGMSDTINSATYFGPILAAVPGALLQSPNLGQSAVLLGLGGGPASQTSVTMGIDQEPTLVLGSITVSAS